MRTTALVTGYIEAAFFLLLGGRCILAWSRKKDKASAHLAIATGFFGISSLIGAISTTVYDQTKGHLPPRAISIISGIIGLLAIYAFLIFLSDFIPFPRWVQAFFGAATIVWIVLSIIERPDLTFDANFNKVYIPGIHNPIHYLTFVGALLAYYAIVLGILWIAFFINGLRVAGLARLRMLLIAAGFFLLFVAIGLIPRILFGAPDTARNRAIITAVEYIAIVSAPFLLLGFAPPKWLSRQYEATAS